MWTAPNLSTYRFYYGCLKLTLLFVLFCFGFVSVPQGTREKLHSLRAAIESSPTDPELSDIVSAIIGKIENWKASGVLDNCDGVILRSSTNVEDLEGFNGAGLYESKSIELSDCSDERKIEATLKYIWASLWNWRGYQERKLFGIKENHVHMAVLVQPFYGASSVHCNGVAITAHPFRNDFPGALINTQLGTTFVSLKH